MHKHIVPFLLSSFTFQEERFSRLAPFDPDPHEIVEVLMAGDSTVSGEPLPELPSSSIAELERQLQLIGVKIVRSPGRLEGWEDAYNAFAEAFTREAQPVGEAGFV